MPPKMAAEAAAAAPRSIPAGAPTDAAAAAVGSKPPTPVLLDEAWPAELSCNEKKCEFKRNGIINGGRPLIMSSQDR